MCTGRNLFHQLSCHTLTNNLWTEEGIQTREKHNESFMPKKIRGADQFEGSLELMLCLQADWLKGGKPSLA